MVAAAQRHAYLAELAALADLRKQRKGDPLVSLLIDVVSAWVDPRIRYS